MQGSNLEAAEALKKCNPSQHPTQQLVSDDVKHPGQSGLCSLFFKHGLISGERLIAFHKLAWNSVNNIGITPTDSVQLKCLTQSLAFVVEVTAEI